MPAERRRGVGQESDNPYYEGRKHLESTVCERCGLVYRGVTGSGRTIFPACRREIDRYPRGYLLTQGGYWQGRWEEILNLVKKQEEARRTRPLHRILWIESGLRREDGLRRGACPPRRRGGPDPGVAVQQALLGQGTVCDLSLIHI